MVARRPGLVALVIALASPALALEGVPVRIAAPGAGPEAAARVFYLKDAGQVDVSSCGPVHARLMARWGLGRGVLGASREGRAVVSAGAQAFVAGKPAEADRLFAAAEREVGCSPALAYNRALCAYGLGHRARAVAALLRALTADPGNPEYREAFDFVCAQYGLDSQVMPAVLLSPELLLGATVGFAAAALAALAVLLAHRGGSWFIVFALLALAACAAGVLLAYDALQARAPVAVVAPKGGALRRVPLDQAQVWMTLAEGTSVRVRGSAGDYVLVETGLRVEGWLHRSLLLEPEEGR